MSENTNNKYKQCITILELENFFLQEYNEELKERNKKLEVQIYDLKERLKNIKKRSLN